MYIYMLYICNYVAIVTIAKCVYNYVYSSTVYKIDNYTSIQVYQWMDMINFLVAFLVSDVCTGYDTCEYWVRGALQSDLYNYHVQHYISVAVFVAFLL